MDRALLRLRRHGPGSVGCVCSRVFVPPTKGFSGGFRRAHSFVLCAGWAGTPECPRVETRHGEGLLVPGNIPVHVLVCWMRICHGVFCFWGILSVPVWAFAGFINLHLLGLFMSLRNRSSGVFQYRGPLCVFASLRKWAGVIPFQHCSLGFLHPPSIRPQPPPPPACLTVPHSLQVPKSPKPLPFSVTERKHILI